MKSESAVKLDVAVDAGHSTVTDSTTPRCNSCATAHKSLKVCTGCKAVRYCNAHCQKSHWKDHKVLCENIQQLQRQEDEKCDQMCSVGNLPKRKVIELVGKRPQIDCEIGGVKTKALWDTGSQVSLISSTWLKNHNVNYSLDTISDVIGRELNVEV